MVKSVALRLAAEGGKAVEQDFDRVGRSAEAAMKRVEAATRPASQQLKLFTQAAAQSGGSSNLSQQLDSLFSVGAESRDRAADVAAYGAELDRLRAKFNPLFAVSRQYEQELEEIARAEKLGAITAMEAGQARERAAERMRPMSNATEELRRGFAGLNSGAIQNASYQIGDFAVQVANGTSPVTAFAQQLPQLLGGLGVWGAVAGAAVAVGVPLAAAFLSSGEEALTLSERIKELDESMDHARETADLVKLGQDELREKFAGTSEQVAALVASMRAREIDELGKSIESVGEGAFSGLSEEIERIRAEFQALGLEFSDDNALAQISGSLGLSLEQTQHLVDAMERFNAAAGSEDRNAIMLDTRQMIEEWGLSAEDLPPAMQEFTSGVETASEKISEAAALMRDLTGAANGAAGASDQLAASMAAAARNAADAHAEFQKLMAAEADHSKARLDAKTAPLAATEDSRTGQARDSQTIPYETRLALQREAEAEARAAANKARSAGESEAAKAARELEQEQETRERVIEGLEFERQQVERTDVARRIAQATRQAGVDLYSAEGQHISQLITEMEALRAETERVDAVNQFAARSLSGLFKGAMEGADGFRSALSDLTGRLADMALSTAFQSFVGGVGGGGGFGATAAGGVFTQIFGIGARARGGPVRAGQPYVVGENQAELFVPDQSGYVYPEVPRAGGGGATQDVRVSVGVSVDDAGALRAYVQSVTSNTVNTAMDGARASFRDGVGRAIADPRLKGAR
ncbi:hypothetical protein [Amaricoccus solimangrovi]|uniref:Bacteriophage tail tape measure N-terminal domain-containing protein n=1 Tax=Amaricoccus solimangrovi TaxID=2589815 RepID=A0A501WFG3_9RHOB|nr:hypothetical protein [Amaricoccus solimangrovi]TPE47225.1 hypothetical protein FJM51_20435 [Amaricoccus solimangrovi]